MNANLATVFLALLAASSLSACKKNAQLQPEPSCAMIDKSLPRAHGVPRVINKAHGDPVNRFLIGEEHLIEFPPIDLLHPGHYLLEAQSPWREPLEFQLTCTDEDGIKKTLAAGTRVTARMQNSARSTIWKCNGNLGTSEHQPRTPEDWVWGNWGGRSVIWNGNCLPSSHWSFEPGETYLIDVVIDAPHSSAESVMAGVQLSYRTGKH